MKAEELEAKLSALLDGITEEDFLKTLDDDDIEYFSKVEPLGVISSAAQVSHTQTAIEEALMSFIADTHRWSSQKGCDVLFADTHARMTEQESVDSSVDAWFSILQDCFLKTSNDEKLVEAICIHFDNLEGGSCDSTDEVIASRIPMKSFQSLETPEKETLENEHLALAA